MKHSGVSTAVRMRTNRVHLVEARVGNVNKDLSGASISVKTMNQLGCINFIFINFISII